MQEEIFGMCCVIVCVFNQISFGRVLFHLCNNNNNNNEQVLVSKFVVDSAKLFQDFLSFLLDLGSTPYVAVLYEHDDNVPGITISVSVKDR